MHTICIQRDFKRKIKIKKKNLEIHFHLIQNMPTKCQKNGFFMHITNIFDLSKNQASGAKKGHTILVFLQIYIFRQCLEIQAVDFYH